jgi:chlorobactene glucosyltransferase
LTPFWLQHQLGIATFLGILLLIALGNLLALRRLGTYPLPPLFPRVSVLLPARNEEAVIGDCVRSLLAQDYPDFEVLVLDDGSTDGTGDVLAALARTDDRLRVLTGRPLPEGWLGKHWACQQLADAATGDCSSSPTRTPFTIPRRCGQGSPHFWRSGPT